MNQMGNPQIRMTSQQFRREFGHNKDPRRQLQGKANRDLGKMFEDMIDKSCAHYRATGAAEIEKTPEPMCPIQSLEQGRFIARYERKAQPDYKGTLRGGRAVVFEAKHTTTGKLEQSRVIEPQAEALGRHFEMGARCFVLAGFDTRFFRIPWEDWRDMKYAFGRKYVTPEDLYEYSLRASVGVLLFLE